MPTKWTQTLIPTARQVPAEAEVPSHQLMLRAGMIRKLGAGVYDYLPLGLRSLHKAMAIIREEMATAGAIEVLLPTIIPLEEFRKTGRDVAYGDNLFRLKDRHGREQALGPTHEEVVTELVSGYVESYKQLPLTLYQIQTKFRDEFRPRFGVLRSREFQMTDAYSFHTTLESLDEIYQKQFDAYCRIFTRCGLPYRTVEAESGPIGGSASHEFMVPSPTGEDTILESDKGNYAANMEKAGIGGRDEPVYFDSSEYNPTGDLTEVHTPNTATIDAVCELLDVEPKFLLKSLLFAIEVEDTGSPKGVVTKQLSDELEQIRFVLAVVRGDHDLNEGKLRSAITKLFTTIGFRVNSLVMANPEKAIAAGFAVGFIGPHACTKRQDTVLIVDHDAIKKHSKGVKDQFWVAGANRTDYHVKHFHWGRDVVTSMTVRGNRISVQDIRNAAEGDPSPKNDGGVLKTTKGIEIGHVFKLGDKYTRAMGVTVTMQDHSRFHPLMGCYGIGVNRILASAIERESPQKGHDDKGIIWPVAIAPYQVIITPIRYEGRMKEVADQLAAELETPRASHGNAALDVLIDDRDERPGVKFNDADLIGIPLRITIGDKTLANNQVEIKPRTAAAADLMAIDQAVAWVIDWLKAQGR